MSAEQNTQERYEELLAGFVLGTLTRSELVEFHALKDRGLPAGAMSIEEAQMLLAELPEALHSPVPSPKLKEKIMAKAFVETPPEADLIPFPNIRHSTFDIRNRAGLPALAWAAILLLALTNAGMFVQTLRLHNQFKDVALQNQKLRKDIAVASNQSDDVKKIKTELARVKLELAHQNDMNEMLTNPTVQVSNMKGTKTDCRARVYYDPDARIVLVCSSSLPNLAPNKDYQLWAMVGGKPVSVGVLKTRKGNAFQLNVSPSVPLDQAKTFAISMEPAGGMPKPTGEIVFAGL